MSAFDPKRTYRGNVRFVRKADIAQDLVQLGPTLAEYLIFVFSRHWPKGQSARCLRFLLSRVTSASGDDQDAYQADLHLRRTCAVAISSTPLKARGACAPASAARVACGV